MDDLANEFSQDLSESSSVVSFESQETDFTDQTDIISNVSVSKKLEFSPTDVRSFPTYHNDHDHDNDNDNNNDMIPHVHLDDPLPVVREGKVLTEESLLEGD